MEISLHQKISIGTVIAAAILVLIGVLSQNVALLSTLILPAMMLVVVPPFFFKFAEFRRIKAIEDQFPNFVRDLADARRSGMSFAESMKLTSRSNYGQLGPEVKLMHNKLSWGVPFLRVLEMFKHRMKASKLICEAVTIISESYMSGGDIAATLNAIARDIRMLKETESERVSMLRQNVMIMYAIFFMFLGISVMIIFVMIPMIKNQPAIQGGNFGFSFSNPCDTQGGFPCSLFQIIGFFLGVPTGISNYYTSIFFLVVVVQGIFSGLIAGQLGENSVVAGTKHSMIMGFSGIGAFLFLARLGLLPT